MNGARFNMTDAIRRSILRWIHIICAIPIIGYIYSPFEQIPNYAPPTRFVFVPVMVLSGLWMWKGHVVQRYTLRRAAWRMIPKSGSTFRMTLRAKSKRYEPTADST
jgi:hypothetical protein